MRRPSGRLGRICPARLAQTLAKPGHGIAPEDAAERLFGGASRFLADDEVMGALIGEVDDAGAPVTLRNIAPDEPLLFQLVEGLLHRLLGQPEARRQGALRHAFGRDVNQQIGGSAELDGCVAGNNCRHVAVPALKRGGKQLAKGRTVKHLDRMSRV